MAEKQMSMILAAIEDELTRRQIRYRPMNLFPRSAQCDQLRELQTPFPCFRVGVVPQMAVLTYETLAHHPSCEHLCIR